MSQAALPNPERHRLIFSAYATPIDYHVVMAKRSATPVRFDTAVAERLTSFTAANPGMSLSSAANRLVDEALRMTEHPGVVFRAGPTGRRAALASGPDIWEAVRAIKSARTAVPDLPEDDLLALVASNTSVVERQLRTAIRYWASYPGEIDTEIATAQAAEDAAEDAWRRERGLLAG
jgi:hypothetical protein